ncbi:unnamed protein product [Jaminaea pallidilutea]
MSPSQARLSADAGPSRSRSVSVAASEDGGQPSSSSQNSKKGKGSGALGSSSLLPFAKSIIRSIVPAPEEALDEGDALIILAKGLGLRSIVAHVLKIYDAPTNLVFVINARPDEEAGLSEELTTLGVRNPGLRSVGYETQQAKRKSMYHSGGIISVTSQILVVDMLQGIVPVELITGLLFLHAEEVTPDSNEAFIAGVYRDRNEEGFLKAFSDEANSFAIGLSPLQTVLGKLKIRKTELWPRFHKSIIRDLGERKADVVELHQPMSRSMRLIQTAIVECLEATLAELRRTAPGVDVEEYSLENSIHRAFDLIVQRQLDPIWNTLGPKSKRLKKDLTQLRLLLNYLLSYDAVQFHEYLEALRAEHTSALSNLLNRHQQMPDWMLLDAANTIFNQARARAYVGDIDLTAETQDHQNGTNGDGAIDVDEDEEEAAFGESSTSTKRSWHPKWLPPGIEPVLEELPKWHLLREVLDEIEQEIYFTEEKPGDVVSPNNTVLIMTSGDRNCNQIRRFLSSMGDCVIGAQDDEIQRKSEFAPGRKMMRRVLKDHFMWKATVGQINSALRDGPAAANGSSNSARNASPQKNGNANAESAYESEAMKRKVPWERGQAPPNKRRRQRGGMASSMSTRQKDPSTASDLLNKEASDFANFYDRALDTVAKVDGDLDGDEDRAEPANSDEDDILPRGDEEQEDDFEITGESTGPVFSEAEFDNYYGVLSMEDLVIVRPYKGDGDDHVLRELRPRFIIMYDPDPAFVRRVELYRSSTMGANPRVYFLLYAESVEEQRYLSSLRKEKESFEKLIREKSMMALPLQAGGRPAQEDPEERSLRIINSRIAGGQRGVTKEQPRIVVDMREFKSSLPPMLYFAGIKVVPCTLNVGDYILSPEMCVERKSLQDLTQSFNSGRLYSQCELMSVHYQHPILLIEFPQDKAFALSTMLGTKSGAATHGGGGGNSTKAITQKTLPTEIDIQTKLVMLTAAFPRLRIIWSSSPYHTADIFTELKSTYEEPDVSKVAAAGLDPTDAGKDGNAAGSIENSFNLTPQDMLRNMPGITTKNFRLIMNQVRDIEELCDLEEAELAEMIGIEAARQLWNFINQDPKRKRKGRTFQPSAAR